MKILILSLLSFLLFIGLTSKCFCEEDIALSEPIAEEEVIPEISFNTTESEIINATESSSNVTNNNAYKIACLINENSTNHLPVIEMVNSTQLLTYMQIKPNITSQQTPATCLIAIFYSPYCQFSCMAAPHFNALPRVFPKIKMVAVDTSTRYNLNTQYNIVGVPTLLIFHNGRPAARFNSSTENTIDYYVKFISQNGVTSYKLESLAAFVTKNTGLHPEGELVVTSDDFRGPISSVLEEYPNFLLTLTKIVLNVYLIYYVYNSSWCKYILDGIRDTWREAEDQHAHNE